MRHLITFPLLTLLSALPWPALAADPNTSTTLDPVEVTAAYQRELLVNIVQLGLERGRSSHKADVDKIACVRDKKPGTRFPQIRCATNGDWNLLANNSLQHATTPTTALVRSSNSNCGYSFLTTLDNNKATRKAFSMSGGVIEVSPRLLAGAPKTPVTPEQRTARIQQLVGMLAAAESNDEFNTPPDEVTRFARTLLAVQRADDAAAAAAITAAGYTIDQYNALVDRYDASERFRARVATAAVAQSPSLVF